MREFIVCVIGVLIILAIGLALVVLVGWIASLLDPVATIPANTQIIYKAVEPTGVYGSAQYYFFDNQGNRYRVTCEQFDKAIDIPRK